MAQIKTLRNVGQEAPCNIEQEKVPCSVVLIRLGQHCTRKTLCNVVLEAPDNIAQAKSFSLLSEFSWDNFAQLQANISGNVVHKASANISHDKIMFNVVVVHWDNIALVKPQCNTQETPGNTTQEKNWVHCRQNNEQHRFFAIFMLDRLIFW